MEKYISYEVNAFNHNTGVELEPSVYDRLAPAVAEAIQLQSDDIDTYVVGITNTGKQLDVYNGCVQEYRVTTNDGKSILHGHVLQYLRQDVENTVYVWGPRRGRRSVHLGVPVERIGVYWRMLFDAHCAGLEQSIFIVDHDGPEFKFQVHGNQYAIDWNPTTKCWTVRTIRFMPK